MKWLYRLFNHDKVDETQRTIDIYRERNEQLEKENREYKGYKLKYEVTKLYVEDDEALIQLFDIAKKHDIEMANRQSGNDRLRSMTAAQQRAIGQFGGVAGLIGGSGGSGQSQFR